MQTWVLARTKVNHERRADINIRRQGALTYLPYFRDHLTKRRKPLFAAYIFVQVQDRCCSFLHSTYGVRSVIQFGERAAVVPESVIDGLKARERNGLIMLPAEPEFRLGERLRLRAGPLVGSLGIYQGMDNAQRVRVLLSLFNRATSVSVPRGFVEAA